MATTRTTLDQRKPGVLPANLIANGAQPVCPGRDEGDEHDNNLCLMLRIEAVVLNYQHGYWQPWREDDCGRLQILPGLKADYSGAPWQLGGCNYVPLEQNDVFNQLAL